MEDLDWEDLNQFRRRCYIPQPLEWQKESHFPEDPQTSSGVVGRIMAVTDPRELDRDDS